MSVERLNNEKKKVKNELRNYDNDFNELFKYQPSSDEKQPFRPLYVYYKKLKEYINKKGGSENMSQEQVEKKIKEIKNERKELRERIQQYQKDFENTHNRKIRYARDIAPIDTEYKRYKDLKAELQRLEDLLNK